MEARYGCRPLQPDCWHATRRAADLDEDSIGILAVPPPSLDALGNQLRRHFGFLAGLASTQQRIVTGGAGSRNLVLEAIGSLPGSASPTTRCIDYGRQNAFDTSNRSLFGS